MPKSHRPYAPEFRQRIIELVRKGRSPEELAQEHARLVTATMTKSKRSVKVFLDWSQNAGSKTTLSPYSLRGRELPTVATPVTWDEVREGAADPLGLEQFRFEEVLERVAIEASAAACQKRFDRHRAGRNADSLLAPPSKWKGLASALS